MSNRNKPQRNEPCPCGSGKKYKKCCYLKKPRSNTLRIEFKKPVDLSRGRFIELRFDNSPLPSLFLDSKKVPVQYNSVTTANYYNKKEDTGEPLNLFDPKKRRKITSYFSTENIGLVRNTIDPTLNFNFIIAVDTSYIPNDSNARCSTGIMVLSRRDNKNIEFIINSVLIAEYFNSQYPPEKSGWIIAIEKFRNTFPPGSHIGVVVDYDLGRIENINSRIEAVVDGYNLPDGFELIYASADTKNDSFCNKLIGSADALSKFIKEDNVLSTQSEELNGNFFSDGRLYKPTLETIKSILE